MRPIRLNRFAPDRLVRMWGSSAWISLSLLGCLILVLASCTTPRPPTTLTPAASHTSSPTKTATSKPTKTLTPSPSPLPPSSTPTSSTTPTATDPPWPPENWHFPDSEVVYSPSAVDFDVAAYLEEAGGFLSGFRQYLMITDWNTGAQVVSRVALENSINPRLLLALLEYQSGCVLGQVEDPQGLTLLGASQAIRQDLYGQLVWAVHELSEGYYGWRAGTLTEFSLTDGTLVTLPQDSNAGTVAIQYLISRLYGAEMFAKVTDPGKGFPSLYAEMFGDPWSRAAQVEPLVPPGTEQPLLTLPFLPGVRWAFTGGPHYAFEGSGPSASLDFAPPTVVTGCYQSEDWVVAMADGLVVRSELGVVVQDLDGDGYEGTGWALMYLHIEDRHRVPLGTMLKAGEQVGHPSCIGGRATGTHVHIARKYNGEWVPAGGPIPFVMDGWTVHDGEAPYLGTMTRAEEVVTAHQYGSYISRIARDD